jgi:hypothetical protein
MTRLAARLEALEERWIQHGFPVEEFFSPGLAPSDTRILLESAGLPPCDEVVDWFSWHDGALPGTKGWIGPMGWSAHRLALALRAREERRQSAQEISATDWGLPVDELWPPALLPIADDGGPGALALDLSRGTAETPVHTIYWDDAEYSARPRAASLADAVDLWIELMEEHDYTWDSTRRVWDGDFAGLPIELRRRAI